MQHDDHVKRREAFLRGWHGIASRPDMRKPEAIYHIDYLEGEVYSRPYYDDVEGFAR